MSITHDGEVFNVSLADNGTLDTVISVNGYHFSFDSEYARNEQGGIWSFVIHEAIEAYLDTRQDH